MKTFLERVMHPIGIPAEYDLRPDGYIWCQENEDEAAAECGCLLVRMHKNSNDPCVMLCELHSKAPMLIDGYRAVVNAVETLDRLIQQERITLDSEAFDEIASAMRDLKDWVEKLDEEPPEYRTLFDSTLGEIIEKTPWGDLRDIPEVYDALVKHYRDEVEKRMREVR